MSGRTLIVIVCQVFLLVVGTYWALRNHNVDWGIPFALVGASLGVNIFSVIHEVRHRRAK
jgi:fatty acid desaturase